MNPDSAKTFVDLAAKTIAVQLRTARQCFDMYQQLISRKGAPDGKHGADFAARLYNDGVDLFREWTAINVNYWKNAADFVLSRNAGFTESPLNPQPATEQQANRTQPPQPPVSDHRARRVDVVMRESVGNESSRTITLENPYESQVEVSFLVSEFTGSDGSSFRPNIRFEPERFVLPAGEERMVVIRVLLAPETFLENQTYLASVVVRGCSKLELVLRVHACAAEPAASDSAADWTYSKPPAEIEPEQNLAQADLKPAPRRTVTASPRKKSARPPRQKGSGDGR